MKGEVELKLGIAPDGSLTHTLLYEGYLLLARMIGEEKVEGRAARVPEDFLSRVLSTLSVEEISKVELRFVGNDLKHRLPEKMLRHLMTIPKPGENPRTVGALLEKLKENSIRPVSRNIIITPRLKKGVLLYDAPSEKDGIGLQLFKVDRYTGISALESGLFAEQVTTYFSPEAALLALLGAAQTFSVAVKISKRTYYYLVTFTPGQMAEIISGTTQNIRVDRYLILRNEVKGILGKVVRRYPSNELLITELLLDLNLADALVESALDKVDLLVIKLALEGNTYKVYEQVPISVVREPPFFRMTPIRDPEHLRKRLWRAIDPERSLLLQAVSTIGKKGQRPEANNALRALNFLYRFVVLGDPLGLKEFARELRSCYEICRAGKGGDCERYLEYLGGLEMRSPRPPQSVPGTLTT